MRSQSLDYKTALRIISWPLTSHSAGSLGALKFLLLHAGPKEVGQDDPSTQASLSYRFEAGLPQYYKMTCDLPTCDNIFLSGRLLSKGKYNAVLMTIIGHGEVMKENTPVRPELRPSKTY